MRLRRLSSDGEEGYPGALNESVTYRLAGASLRIEYAAESGADTLCSLTNHSYFNLNGSGVYSAVPGHGGHLPAVVLLYEGAVAPQKASSGRR